MQTEIERIAANLVRNEVHCCLSHVVATLASGYVGDSTRPLADLCNQAAELCAPLDDWEEAAVQEGWAKYWDEFGVPCWRDSFDGSTYAASHDGKVLCETFDIEPYQREIFEHWAVSQRLAEDLASLGERVDTDFANLCVWGRTTTGQMIEMDSTMLQVAQIVHERAKAITEEVA